MGEKQFDYRVGEEFLKMWPDFGHPFRWFEGDYDFQEGFYGFFDRGKIRHCGGVRSRGVLRHSTYYGYVGNTRKDYGGGTDHSWGCDKGNETWTNK